MIPAHGRSARCARRAQRARHPRGRSAPAPRNSLPMRLHRAWIWSHASAAPNAMLCRHQRLHPGTAVLLRDLASRFAQRTSARAARHGADAAQLVRLAAFAAPVLQEACSIVETIVQQQLSPLPAPSWRSLLIHSLALKPQQSTGLRDRTGERMRHCRTASFSAHFPGMSDAMDKPLWTLSAVEAVRLLKDGQVRCLRSCRSCMGGVAPHVDTLSSQVTPLQLIDAAEARIQVRLCFLVFPELDGESLLQLNALAHTAGD